MLSLSWACSKGTGRGSVHSILQKEGVGRIGSPLQQGLQPGASALTLGNVTGLADSLSVNHDGQDYCGFIAWSADSQDGPIAVEGRTLESFDLGNPKDWRSQGTGLREGCQGGHIFGAEAYFAYIDLHLSLVGGSEVVRLVLGETGNYKVGDVLVGSPSGAFQWIDATSSALIPENSGRPASPYRYPALAALQVPYVDNGRTVVMTKVPMRVDTDTQGRTVSQTTAKVVFEVDFDSIELTATDTSSPAALGKTLSVPFLDAIRGDPAKHLLVKITPLEPEAVGTDADPAPELGNGNIVKPDAGSPDAGTP
jgi:hypothetical protein